MSTASQPLDDGSEPPPVDIDALYFEALGGEKMRHVYGLRSQAIFIYLASFQVAGSHIHQRLLHQQLKLERLCSKRLQIRKQRWRVHLIDEIFCQIASDP